MAQKKSRQTFEKLKREQAVKEKRLRKQERKAAAKLAKAEGYEAPEGAYEHDEHGEEQPGPSVPQEG
jgi:hypothetical protein